MREMRRVKMKIKRRLNERFTDNHTLSNTIVINLCTNDYAIRSLNCYLLDGWHQFPGN